MTQQAVLGKRLTPGWFNSIYATAICQCVLIKKKKNLLLIKGQLFIYLLSKLVPVLTCVVAAVNAGAP